jgi:hypothetical protein
MLLKRILLTVITLASLSQVGFAFADDAKVTPQDPKYCTMLSQLQKGMHISDVFLLLGPPSTFGQPPNLNMNAISNPNTKVIQPQTALTNDSAAARERIKSSMANDPILGAFINAPENYQNVLIWQFENNTLNVAIKVTGPTVTDVSANFNC